MHVDQGKKMAAVRERERERERDRERVNRVTQSTR